MDPVRHARELRETHARYADTVASRQAPPPQVRPLIVDSWRRSAQAGVRPSGSFAPRLHSAEEVHALRQGHPLARLLPIFRHLLLGVADAAKHLVVVCGADGELLWVEGQPRLRELAEETMNFAEGTLWSEGGAGTNALGTALAVGHPIQVFAAEHFNATVHPWTCSAAPLHDAESGGLLGTIDLTGPFRTAHPHSLALVTAAARIAESTLRQELYEHDERLRRRYLERLSLLGGRPTAVVSAGGRVVMANPPGWLGERVDLAAGRAGTLPDGTPFAAEPIGLAGAFLVWAGAERQAAPPRPRLRLQVLGRASAQVNGRVLRLSGRHAEILTLLALSPDGLTGEELGVALYGASYSPTSVRAEVSRLRRLLGPALGTKPYRLLAQVEADVCDLVRDLDAGSASQAMARYKGGLLPRSHAPAIVEARAALEGRLRRAALASGSVDVLWSWCDSPPGWGDDAALAALEAALPAADPRRDVVLARRAGRDAGGAHRHSAAR
ncbi:MAG: GAF domain-containing protein [Actinomycetota bacterium]